MTAFPAPAPAPAPRKLYRDPARGVFGGVAAGVAEYLTVDVTAVRVVFAILAIVTFFTMVLVYLVMWAFVPPRPPPGAPWQAPAHQS